MCAGRAQESFLFGGRFDDYTLCIDSLSTGQVITRLSDGGTGSCMQHRLETFGNLAVYCCSCFGR